MRSSLYSLIPYKHQSLHAHVMHALRRILRPTDVPDTGLLCDVLWADPDPNLRGWAESDRGVSFTVRVSEVVLMSAPSFATISLLSWCCRCLNFFWLIGLLSDFWACSSVDFCFSVKSCLAALFSDVCCISMDTTEALHHVSPDSNFRGNAVWGRHC